MKKHFIIVIAFCLVLPSLAVSETIEGTIQGYNCVTQGKPCPTGSDDPLVASEFTFVLVTADNILYFLPDIERARLANHVAENARIMGKINQVNNNKSIEAKTIEVNNNGKWRTIYDSYAVFDPIR